MTKNLRTFLLAALCISLLPTILKATISPTDAAALSSQHTTDASMVCTIFNITLLPITTCNDAGTPSDPTDDFYLADITIDFIDPIVAGGTLEIFGSVGYNFVPDFFLLGTTSYTFLSVSLPANGLPASVTSQFSIDPACSLTIGGFPAVASCGVSSVCAFTIAPTTTNISCNGLNDGAAAAGVLTPSGCTYNWSGGLGTASNITGLSPGSYSCTVTNPSASSTVTNLFFDNFDGAVNWIVPGISVGAEDVDANLWVIDDFESWDGVCGSGNLVTPGDRTLHIFCNSIFCGLLGNGAIYDAGGGFTNTTTSKIAPMTSGISTVGYTNIGLDFNWRCEGEAGTLGVNGDLGYVSYSIDGGATWVTLGAQYYNSTAWQCETLTLPAVCAGIPDLRVGFRWENDNNGVGLDPAFAIDDVTITGETAGAACDTVITFNITQPITLTVDAGAGQNICPGATITLTAVAAGGTTPIGFNWVPGGLTTASITLTPIASTTYTVTATDANGCSFTDVIPIIISPLTCCTFTTTDPAPVCFGTCVDLTNPSLVTVSEPGSFAYFSTVGCTGSLLPNPSQVCVSGTYYIQFSSLTGCIICQPINVLINPGGQGNITTNDTLYCNQNQNFTLAATPVGGVYSGSGITAAGVFNPSTAGLGYHQIVYDLSAFGVCATYDTLTVHVVDAPVPTFDIQDTICLGEPVLITYTGDVAFVSVYDWDFDNGTVVSGALGGPYLVIWNTSGPKDIELTITAGAGCQVVVAQQIEVEFVDVNTIDNATIQIGDAIQLVTTGVPSIGLYTYIWQANPTLNCDTCQNPFAKPIEDQQYVVGIYDQNGCEAYDTVTIFVEVNRSIFIPNSFTPNDDQLNDVFEVVGLTTSEITMTIYNRWGEKMYEQASSNPKWDGLFKGRKLDPGVYIYVLDARYLDGVRRSFKGNVTLLR